ncbi:MAG: sugar transferase [Paracoccaceae bacterium]
MTLMYRVFPEISGMNLHVPVVQSTLPETPLIRFAETRVSALEMDAAPRRTSRLDFYRLMVKRPLDILLSIVAIVLVAPVIGFLALALWIESGNPFFSQERIGRNGRHFRMYKLRTMIPGADRILEDCLRDNPALREEWARTQKLKSDPRVTPLGRLLRRTSMDEIPQILNVLKGDMSLVGPRPMLPQQLALYRRPEAYLALRPGITGLWQVTARNDASFELRSRLDARYEANVTLWMDFRIIRATFGAVFKATGY